MQPEDFQVQQLLQGCKKALDKYKELYGIDELILSHGEDITFDNIRHFYLDQLFPNNDESESLHYNFLLNLERYDEAFHKYKLIKNIHDTLEKLFGAQVDKSLDQKTADDILHEILADPMFSSIQNDILKNIEENIKHSDTQTIGPNRHSRRDSDFSMYTDATSVEGWDIHSAEMDGNATGDFFHQREAILEKLKSHCPAAKSSALETIATIPAGDILCSDFWVDLRCLLKNTLTDDDKRVEQGALRIHAQLFQGSPPETISDVYLNVLLHLTQLFSTKKQFPDDCTLQGSEFEALVSKFRLLERMQIKLPSYWTHSPEQGLYKLHKLTYDFFALNPFCSCKGGKTPFRSPLYYMSLVDPLCRWHKKWTGGSTLRSQIASIMKENGLLQEITAVVCGIDIFESRCLGYTGLMCVSMLKHFVVYFEGRRYFPLKVPGLNQTVEVQDICNCLVDQLKRSIHTKSFPKLKFAIVREIFSLFNSMAERQIDRPLFTSENLERIASFALEISDGQMLEHNLEVAILLLEWMANLLSQKIGAVLLVPTDGSRLSNSADAMFLFLYRTLKFLAESQNQHLVKVLCSVFVHFSKHTHLLKYYQSSGFVPKFCKTLSSFGQEYCYEDLLWLGQNPLLIRTMSQHNTLDLLLQPAFTKIQERDLRDKEAVLFSNALIDPSALHTLCNTWDVFEVLLGDLDVIYENAACLPREDPASAVIDELGRSVFILWLICDTHQSVQKMVETQHGEAFIVHVLSLLDYNFGFKDNLVFQPEQRRLQGLRILFVLCSHLDNLILLEIYFNLTERLKDMWEEYTMVENCSSNDTSSTPGFITDPCSLLIRELLFSKCSLLSNMRIEPTVHRDFVTTPTKVNLEDMSQCKSELKQLLKLSKRSSNESVEWFGRLCDVIQYTLDNQEVKMGVAHSGFNEYPTSNVEHLKTHHSVLRKAAQILGNIGNEVGLCVTEEQIFLFQESFLRLNEKGLENKKIDWFSGLFLLLLSSKNIELAFSAIEEFLPFAAFRILSPNRFSSNLGLELVHSIMESEFPTVLNWFQGIGISPLQMADQWMRQCLLNSLDLREACLALAMCFVYGPDYFVYITTLMLVHIRNKNRCCSQETQLVVNNSKLVVPTLEDAWGEESNAWVACRHCSLDDFRIWDHIQSLTQLELRYRSMCMVMMNSN